MSKHGANVIIKDQLSLLFNIYSVIKYDNKFVCHFECVCTAAHLKEHPNNRVRDQPWS